MGKSVFMQMQCMKAQISLCSWPSWPEWLVFSTNLDLHNVNVHRKFDQDIKQKLNSDRNKGQLFHANSMKLAHFQSKPWSTQYQCVHVRTVFNIF